mmetsp:Transcript_64026/g.73644  ORF Transcript_64026/g.73644 Transcript_64026/m.73644 type:complete len:303 (-) Transcript_64026:278-1186(-)
MLVRWNFGATAALLRHLCPASSYGLFAAAGYKRSIFQPIVVRTTRSSRLLSSPSSLSSAMDEEITSSLSSSLLSTSADKIKVLSLHGSGGTTEEFPKRLHALNKALMSYSSNNVDDGTSTNNVQLEITTVEGPFDKDDGYSWWTMPQGVRSFNAKEYTGFEESATKVLGVWEKGEFDIVLGHSQGAILIASLLALKRTPYHPPGGYIMNGVSFPNPYTQQLESLSSVVNDNCYGSPNVLFVFGKQDNITPNTSGEQLLDLLQKGGFAVSSCYHDGGHGFPEENEKADVMKTIVDWILQRQRH